MAGLQVIVLVMSVVALAFAAPQEKFKLNLSSNSILQKDVKEFDQLDVDAECDGTGNELLPYPLHASCSVEWTFGVDCDEVSARLIKQIDLWSGPENCEGGGEKCLYKVTSSKKRILRGTHATPVAMYIDNFFFRFIRTRSGCYSKSYSYSTVPYAVLDSGTNYCNMFNLVEGSGLNKEPKFTENTCNKICTQYTTADCDVYKK